MIKQMTSQKKRDGGIIKFSLYIFKFILITKVLIFLCFETIAKTNKSFYVIRDAEIEFFLQNLINDLLVNKNLKINSISPRLILDENYNAFVVGDNKIYVNTGLIQNSTSKEEIQGVLAHELGHLFLGHIQSRKLKIRNNNKKIFISTFAFLGLALGKEQNLSGVLIATQDLMKKNQSKFSKHQELEADIYAINSLNNMNVSLLGMQNFHVKAKSKQDILGSPYQQYYSTHPSSEERLNLIKNFIRENPTKLSTNLNFKTFSINLETLKLKTFVYHKNLSKLESIQDYEETKLQNYLELSKLYLRGDIKNSIRLAEELKKSEPQNPYNYLLSGDINVQSNKLNKAISEYKYAIKLINKNTLNALPKISLAKALIKKENEYSLVEALNILEEIMPYESSTTFFWRLIAEASGKLKLKSKAYIALAEEQILKKNIKKAKQFALLGLQDKKLDFIYKLRAEDILNLK